MPSSSSPAQHALKQGNSGSSIEGEGQTWLAATLDARRRAVEAAGPEARAVSTVRLARALGWAGQDNEATRVLANERRAQQRRGARAELCRLELGMAEAALVADDEDRAATHLAAAIELPNEDDVGWRLIEGWIAARRGAQRPFPDKVTLPQNANEAPWLGELVDSIGVELLWSHGDALSLSALGIEPRAVDVRTRALLELRTVARAGDAAGVRHLLRSLERAGLSRDLGRALLRLLAIDEDFPQSTGSDARSWIMRAQVSLGESATWRDKIALRHAWRAHGRREADRALPPEIAIRLDARERMRAHVQSTVAVGIDRQTRAIDDLELALDRDLGGAAGVKTPTAVAALEATRDTVELLDAATGAALGELGRVEGELAQIVASTFAERERARAIATTLAGLEAVHDVDELLAGLARGIQELIGASAVVMAERVPYVGLRPLVTRGMEPNDDSWLAEAEAALDTPVSSKSKPPAALRATMAGTDAERERDRRGGSEAPNGPVLVVPVRGAGTEGAIYADKRALGGSFSATDRAALELLASYSGVALARLRAQSASESLGKRLAATIDAMRDGLLAVDTKGFVTALNEPAARALRVDPARVLGRRLADIAELQPIAASLALTDRPDGAVVRTPHTSLLVNARAVEGEGIVATLIEYERAQRIAQKLAGPRARYTFADLRGNDPLLLEALDIARRASTVDGSVLIIGESGTGKELLSQAIHSAGPRAREPFVAINCAALPRDLLEAELFGYERGAFTGARAEGSIGKFEQAGDGTILLDEIVDLPLDMQAKLLRVLQERVVVRLGSSVERPVRARVMATAQRDLAIDVERGRFRLDLLHRLRVLQVTLPALRNRPGDISIIARHYIRQFAERQGKAVRDMAPDVEHAFSTYAWPGNVRELANVIEGEVSLLGPESPLLERVPSSIARLRASEPPVSGRMPSREPPNSLTPETLSRIPVYDTQASIPISDGPILPLAEVERRAYLEAYEKSNRSVSRAARALGVSKVTFYGKLRQFGMHPSEVTGETPSLRASSLRIPVAAQVDAPPNAYERDAISYLAVPDSRRDDGDGPESTRLPPTPPSNAPRSRRGS